MSSHPGSTLAEAVELAEYVRDMGFNPEQVQDFYPTPSTISTCMYYTGLNPLTMEPVYVPRSPREKAMQRALIQYRNPANYDLVREALEKSLGQPSVAKLTWRPKTGAPIEGETVQTLLDLIAALEDNDDVQNVYANFEVSDDALAKFAA